MDLSARYRCARHHDLCFENAIAVDIRSDPDRILHHLSDWLMMFDLPCLIIDLIDNQNNYRVMPFIVIFIRQDEPAASHSIIMLQDLDEAAVAAAAASALSRKRFRWVSSQSNDVANHYWYVETASAVKISSTTTSSIPENAYMHGQGPCLWGTGKPLSVTFSRKCMNPELLVHSTAKCRQTLKSQHGCYHRWGNQ